MATRKTVQEIDAQRAELVKEWQTINTRIQPGLDRIAEIKAELETLPVLKYSVPGIDLKLDVTQGSSFVPEMFTAKYPPTTHPQFYKAVPDQDRIKRDLPPAELETFRKANKASVKLV